MAPETDDSASPVEGTTGNVTQSREDFEPNRGAVPRELDVADNEHPVKEELDGEYRHTLSAHEGTVGERFAFRYSRAEAFIREYLANAETGLIRRARHELRQYDASTYDSEWFQSHGIPELFDEARDVVGYHPIIETHSAPRGSQRARFKIEDNGVGVSIEEFKAMRELGLSPSHGEGKQLGSFGQGVMSVFNAVGKFGELTLTTWSVLDDANYRERFRIREFNDLPGKRDEYGTTWTVPSFSDEAKDMDVDAAVEEFADAMYAPVLHHSYDEEGVETGKEEYTYTPLVEMVDDDETTFVYEDDYIEAVMSPAIDDPETFLVTMPIERSCGTGSMGAPYKFHVRIKEEDGSVYHSGSDGEDTTGLVPVEDRRYENEQIAEREAIYWDQSVPGDLFAYDIDDSDHYHVPPGVDDELVGARDDLVLWDGADRPTELDHPATDTDLNPVIVDGPHEGHRVVSKQVWESIETDVDDTFVPRGNLDLGNVSRRDLTEAANPNCDVKLAEPVDDRDRLKEHDGSLFYTVSARLRGVLNDQAAELFKQLRDDGFDAWYDFDEREREVFTVVYDHYIHDGTEPTSQYVMGNVESRFGVTLPQDVCEQLTVLSREIELAPRNCGRPNRKAGRKHKTVNDVLQKAGSGGDVYMGATVHAGKAQLAWALGDDNQVISVSSASKYEEYTELFGWTPLRSLDLTGIAQKYDVDDDTADLLERDTSQSSHSGGVSLDDLDAATREIKLRTQKKRHYTSSTPKEVQEELNGDSGCLYGDHSTNIRHLLVYPETEFEGVESGSDLCVGSIGRTIVPKYVAEFLETVDRCYLVEPDTDESDIMDEVRSNMADCEIETIDIDPFVSWVKGSQAVCTVNPNTDIDQQSVSLDDAGEETACILLPDRLHNMVTGESEMAESKSALGTIIKSIVEEDAIDETIERVAIIEQSTINQSILTWVDPTRPDDLDSVQAQFGDPRDKLDSPTVVSHKNASTPDVESERWSPSNDVVIDIMLPEDEFERDTDVWNHIVSSNSWSIKKQRSSGKTIVDLLHRLSELTPDDEPTLKK